jgi:hypothetical protein
MARYITFIFTAALTALAACTSREPPAAEATPAATNPTTGMSREHRGARIKGRIAEKLTAGSYTYMALTSAEGSPRWAVVIGKDLPPEGQEIEIISMGSRKDFYSGRLKRRFDEVMFAMVVR